MALTTRELTGHPAVRNYTLLCLIALLVLALALVQSGQTWGALVLVLLGSVALVAHWSIAPPLLVASLVGILVTNARTRYYPLDAPEESSTLSDLALCMAVLAYVAGHYRLQALLHHVLPPDPRVRTAARWWASERKKARGSFPSAPSDLTAPPRRSVELVAPDEIFWLVISFPLWAGIAFIVWVQVEFDIPPLEMAPPAWRALQIFGLVSLGLAATAALLGYLGKTLASADVNLLYLQDQAWRATRGEQTRINRWFVWTRLRGQRRKEMR